jgi:hypothetical protein
MRDGKQPMSSSATSPWNRPLIGCFYAVLAVMLTAATPATSQEVGAASKVVNKVLGKSLGYEIRADQKINFREEINTLAKSGSTVSFKDGTALSIGEDSQLTIDEFVYDPASGSAKGAMRVVKGVLRFASGASKTKAVSIETQTAMIGIRGTILDVAADRQRTGVFVHVGEVTVQAVGNSLQLGAGQFALIEASGVPAIVPVPLWFIERTRGMASMLGLPEKPTAAAAAPTKGRATVAPLR